MSTYEGSKWKAVELWAAILMEFHFPLRVGEVANTEGRDIPFRAIEEEMCANVIIRGSKTDQQKNGSKSTLRRKNCDLCPVLNLATWADAKSWNPDDGEWVFSRNIGQRINHSMRELAIEHGLDGKRFPTHIRCAHGALLRYMLLALAPLIFNAGGDREVPYTCVIYGMIICDYIISSIPSLRRRS